MSIKLQRLGIIMEPEMGNENEAEGVLNRAATRGPRIALAQSTDLFNWKRLGLADFAPYKRIDFNGIYTKDACMFPLPVNSLHQHISMAMLHRPPFSGTTPEETKKKPINRRSEIIMNVSRFRTATSING